MENIAKSNSVEFITSILTLALMVPSILVAAEDQHDGKQVNRSFLLEEIVVTAQKRDESAQDIGIAITTFSGDQLRKMGVVESTDVAAFTPGVSLSGSFAGQQKQFSIRGVTQNDFNDHVEAPIAVYIDEGYVAFQQGSVFATFDVERVEVLRGPQGTLFGRNATGGLVHYITRGPTDDLEGYIDATYGEYNQLRLESAVSGPIGEGISYRVSGLFSDHDGYLKNEFPKTFVPADLQDNLSNGPGPEEAGTDLGADKTWALRGKLAIDLRKESLLDIGIFLSRTTQSSAPYQSVPVIAVLDSQGRTLNTLRVDTTETREFISPVPGFDNGFDNDFDGVRPVPGGDFYGYIDPDDNDFQTSSDYAFDDSNTYETYGSTVRFSTDFDGVAFSSITDFKHHEKVTVLDVDGAPESQFYWISDADIDSITQELRLAGNTDNFRWVTGAYYLNIDALAITGLNALPNGTVLPSFGYSDFDEPRIADLKTESYSLFGQIEYDINSSLRLIGGLRGTKENKKYIFDVRYAGNNTDPLNWDNDALNAPSDRPEGEFSDDTGPTLWTGKLQLDWQVNNDVLAYVGFNRGVKAGSFNSGGISLSNADVPYDKEVLHAYELGIKSYLADGRARLNVAMYYYDYKDYQASRWDGLGNVVTNNDSTVKGFEIELATSPFDNLDLMLSFSYIDALVKDLDLVGDGSILVDVRPTFSPESTFSVFARYTIPGVFYGEFALQASSTYQSSIYHNLSNFDSTKFDGWMTTDIRLDWASPNGKWNIDMFVSNVFDKRYDVIGFDLATICGCNTIAQGKPRWAGISLRHSF
jgi:iron complex outermembrane receptor protein